MRISDWSSDVCSSDLLRSGSRKTTIFGSPSSKCRSVLNDSPAERFARMEGHDLADPFGNARFPALEGDRAVVQRQAVEARPVLARKALEPVESAIFVAGGERGFEIGRASCREGVCTYV